MFIIGYIYTPERMGAVDKFECPKCLHQSVWQLVRVQKHFTLFFIPIIPAGNVYSLFCEVCNHQEILSKREYLNYKIKSDIELSFSAGEITANEKEIKTNEINFKIEQGKKARADVTLEGSKEWSDLVSQKADDELFTIYFKERYKYNPSMIVAVEAEMEKRKRT